MIKSSVPAFTPENGLSPTFVSPVPACGLTAHVESPNRELGQRAQAEGPGRGVTGGGLELPSATVSGETRGAILRDDF
ncbi:hypothetical protein ACLOJK_017096 [Asimina triloba]